MDLGQCLGLRARAVQTRAWPAHPHGISWALARGTCDWLLMFVKSELCGCVYVALEHTVKHFKGV